MTGGSVRVHPRLHHDVTLCPAPSRHPPVAPSGRGSLLRDGKQSYHPTGDIFQNRSFRTPDPVPRAPHEVVGVFKRLGRRRTGTRDTGVHPEGPTGTSPFRGLGGPLEPGRRPTAGREDLDRHFYGVQVVGLSGSSSGTKRCRPYEGPSRRTPHPTPVEGSRPFSSFRVPTGPLPSRSCTPRQPFYTTQSCVLPTPPTPWTSPPRAVRRSRPRGTHPRGGGRGPHSSVVRREEVHPSSFPSQGSGDRQGSGVKRRATGG